MDGVASDDSRKLVEGHIEKCEECRKMYESPEHLKLENLEIDNDRVIGKIKRKLYSFAGLILVLGSLIGANLNNSQSVFYNFLIMPILGGVSYLAFGRKAYLGSIFVFIISFVNQTINNYLIGYFLDFKEIILDAFTMTLQFIIFFFVGIVIFKLINISIYGWEGNQNEKRN